MSLAGPVRASEFASRGYVRLAVDRSWRGDPRRFGRACPRAVAVTTPRPARSLAADLRLFAVTFLAGFLFISILLA
jgi:hypothetical protein